MKKSNKNSSADVLKLNRCIEKSVKNFTPPEDLTVDQWADKYRILSQENSAEPGLWRTNRTPYLREIMKSFTDPKVRRIVMVAASQVGKSEAILNMIGYVIDQDPGSILFVQPTLDDAKKFSRLRVAPMIRDSKRLRNKVADVKAKDSGNTILQKSFPGGMLTITGSNSASALASTPARYIFGDERDRWATSAGTEGDPWSLAEARQTTFYNAKAVEVSTPTVRGASAIETSFNLGTREKWCTKCPECGEYSEINFDRIRFKYDKEEEGHKTHYRLTDKIYWACPNCGCAIDEETARRQPSKWIPESPEAYGEKGIRSFWLNAFCSPWTPWSRIVYKFLDAHKDPARLQVVYNTLLGKLWENRGNIQDSDELMQRREYYGEDEDGKPVEVPDGCFVLTLGVDTQDNRFEYEILGTGYYGETWGIKRGFIMGSPEDQDTWRQLDELIDGRYKYSDGTSIGISCTCIDSGGHFTQEVYEHCRNLAPKRVFAIKGKAGDGIPYVAPPNRVAIRGNRHNTCWLYTIGVDSGKTQIMANLRVEEPGAKYCHFPIEDSRGYDARYFEGLLSEKLVMKEGRNGTTRWAWEKISSHIRNEPLDCRNYAMAAFRILNPDIEAAERRRIQGTGSIQTTATPGTQVSMPQKLQRRKRSAVDRFYENW